ncbi:MAG: lactonase family protein [Burkholderiaceae bacterium]|nr:lactonase family protein [Burkholderiaceae bacterium]
MIKPLRPQAVFVGTSGPLGQGIHAFAHDEGSGLLSAVGVTPHRHSPSWLTVCAGARTLYAVNEHGDDEGPGGSLSAYRLDATSGALSLLSTVPSGGIGPVHMSLHPQGRHVFVAHYGSADVAVVSVAVDGRPGEVMCTRRAAGTGASTLGPTKAARGPAGSHANSGHDAPHAHMAQCDPSGRHVLVTDLGLDCIVAWRFDAASGELTAPQRWQASPGAGPRHLVFHPQDAGHCYVLSEESSTLSWLAFDADSGALTTRSELSSLPPGYQGTSYASDLRISADGRHLYALNRLHDSIAIFALAADGAPSWQGEVWAHGSYPRSCTIDPSGRWLHVCNQRSDQVTSFAIADDGGLQHSGQYVGVGNPTALVFA